jgi:hypothetical protein
MDDIDLLLSKDPYEHWGYRLVKGRYEIGGGKRSGALTVVCEAKRSRLEVGDTAGWKPALQELGDTHG